MDSILAQAITTAVTAHQEQHNPHGMPYILHPLRVMERVRLISNNNHQTMAVAVLHDVLKGTMMTANDLRVFNPTIAYCVKTLTRVYGEKYDAYIRRLAGSAQPEIVLVVKLACIADNLQQGRDTPLSRDKQRYMTERYIYAQSFLNECFKERFLNNKIA